MNTITYEGDDERDIYLDQLETAIFNQDTNWVEEANCKDLESDLLFSSETNKRMTKYKLLNMCNECPVRRQCFNSIMDFESNQSKAPGFGWFAGLYPINRIKIKTKTNDRDEQYKLSTDIILNDLTKINKTIIKIKYIAIKKNKGKRRAIDKICNSHDNVLAFAYSESVDSKHYLVYYCNKDEGHYVTLKSDRNATV